MRAKSGIHLPNGPIRDKAGMLNVGFTHFTLLDGEAAHIPDLRRASPNGVILVRFYLKPWPSFDPAAWADHCVAEYDRDRGGWSMRSLGVHITPANEQNLEEEGGGSTQQWYERIRDWLNVWLDRVSTRIPRDRLHFPAFAYGHSDDDASRGYCGMEICRSAIQRFEIIDCHPYWMQPDEVAVDWRGQRFVRTHALFPTQPIFCSETGNFDTARVTAPQEMVEWFTALDGFDYVIGGTPFIWEDPTGAHWQNDWSRNPAIAREVKAAIDGENTSGGGGESDTMTEAELRRIAADTYARAGIAWNPDGAITKFWYAQMRAGNYLGEPTSAEFRSESGRFVIQQFAGAMLFWDSVTGSVSPTVPLSS